MLRKNWRLTPTTAAHMNTSPMFEAMKGQRMYSPEPTPRPARITLGPSILLSGNGSGMSRKGMGGTLRLGAISANSSGGLPAVPTPSGLAPLSPLRSMDFSPFRAVRFGPSTLQNHLLPRDNTSPQDRKSTRLNSSHANISYAVFCLKKKK